MQDKSQSFLEFSERTEVLAKKSGLRLSDLPVNMGLSNGMFHACRSGKTPISPKTWRKLESAERAAGIGIEKPATPDRPAESVSNPNESGTGGDQFPDAGKMMPETLAALSEIFLAGAEAQATSFFRHAAHLAKVAADRGRRSDDPELTDSAAEVMLGLAAAKDLTLGLVDVFRKKSGMIAAEKKPGAE